MPTLPWLLSGIAGAAAWAWWQRARRAELALAHQDSPLPPDWLGWVEANVPLYRRMPSPLQAELLGRTVEFLNQKNFEGFGLKVSPEMKVTVAAQACLLWLRRQGAPFPALHTVRLFPSSFRAGDNPIRREPNEGGLSDRLDGEACPDGVIAMAWDEARRSGRHLDGENLVLHEFAHNLDQASGATDGVPHRDHCPHLGAWSRAHQDGFKKLQTRLKRRAPALLDAYAASNEAEFFAVATEAFFERPERLKALSPKFYRVLTHYYRVDPSAWSG